VKPVFLVAILTLSFSVFAMPNAEHPSQLNRRKIIELPAVTDGEIRVAFFDADSTLRVSKSGTPWASYDSDYIILPGVVEKIRALNQSGYFVAIVSNQGRIPQSLDLPEADRAIMNLILDLKKQGATVNYFDFADRVDENRKPNIGMFNRLQTVLKSQMNRSIDQTQSVMVGDAAYTVKDTMPDGRQGHDFSNADRLFAQNAHIRFEYAPEFFGWAARGFSQIKNRFHARILQLRLQNCANTLAGDLTPTMN
jgi:DNA 3'-phosphatase